MVHYKIKEEWFEKGVDYALKSWTSTFNRMGKPNPYSRIEKIILGIIAENAVTFFFDENNIVYNESGKTRWYEIDRFDVGIGKYSIDVKANYIDVNSKYIQNCFSNIFQNKENWFQKCMALVPLDQFNPKSKRNKKLSNEKVYIFPFIEGTFKENTGDSVQIHAFWDYRWLKRAEHKNLKSLGNLRLEYNGATNGSTIILYGTDRPKNLVKEEISLSRNNIITETKYHQVFAIRVIKGKIDGDLIIKSTAVKIKETIKNNNNFLLQRNNDNKYYPTENNWQNLKLHNGVVNLLGWITDNDLRLIGKKIPRFSKNIAQYSETKVDNWGCPVNELYDMEEIKKLKSYE